MTGVPAEKGALLLSILYSQQYICPLKPPMSQTQSCLHSKNSCNADTTTSQ